MNTLKRNQMKEHTPEWWDIEHEKCKESLSYFYNKYWRTEGAPPITEQDIRDMIKSYQRLPIKPRGHLYTPPEAQTFIYPDDGLKYLKENLDEMTGCNYGKHIIVSPGMETAMSEAIRQVVEKHDIKLVIETGKPRPFLDEMKLDMLEISKIHKEQFGTEEKYSHKPRKGPIHIPKRNKFKKR